MLPLVEKKDELRWDDEANKLRTKISSTYKDIAAELPHELEHYFADTDIRLKDQNYRVRQDQFVARLVASLEEKE